MARMEKTISVMRERANGHLRVRRAAPLLLAAALLLALIGQAPFGAGSAASRANAGVPSSGSGPRTLLTSWTFSGNVYRGQPGDYSTPLAGVTVAIYGANSTRGWGTWIRETTTNRSGAFSLTVWDDDGAYKYYNIVETDPQGYVSTGARSGSGGEVVSANWIRFHNPSPGGYAENFFWDVPSPTATPTATFTVVRPTHTPSATPTATFTVVRPTHTQRHSHPNAHRHTYGHSLDLRMGVQRRRLGYTHSTAGPSGGGESIRFPPSFGTGGATGRDPNGRRRLVCTLLRPRPGGGCPPNVPVSHPRRYRRGDGRSL